MRYTNNKNLPLAIAVWLATDDYNHQKTVKTISATSLLNSTRRNILSSRISEEEAVVDVATLIESRTGTAIHDAISKAWLSDGLPDVLKSLGLPKKIAEGLVVNPGEPNKMGVYVEIRTNKELNGWTISGEFDFAVAGKVTDFKSTGVYTYIKDSKSQDYIDQLSIYKWLNPLLIYEPIGNIDYLFKDWKAYETHGANYPPFKILESQFTLREDVDTEKFIAGKLALLDFHWDDEESDLPLCTPKELWQGPSTWKYYGNPAKLTKATKCFDNPTEANNWSFSKGKGIVLEVQDEPTACRYCNAIGKCSQGQNYIARGILKLD